METKSDLFEEGLLDRSIRHLLDFCLLNIENQRLMNENLNCLFVGFS